MLWGFGELFYDLISVNWHTVLTSHILPASETQRLARFGLRGGRRKGNTPNMDEIHRFQCPGHSNWTTDF